MNKRILFHYHPSRLWNETVNAVKQIGDFRENKVFMKSHAYIRDPRITSDLLLNRDVQYSYEISRTQAGEPMSQILMTSEGDTLTFGEIIFHMERPDSDDRLNAVSKQFVSKLTHITNREILSFQIDSQAYIRYSEGIFEGTVYLVDILERTPILHFDNPSLPDAVMTAEQMYNACDKVLSTYRRKNFASGIYDQFTAMAREPARV